MKKPKMTEDGKMYICEICDKECPSLSTHIKAHKMTSFDYRMKFGMKITENLSSLRFMENCKTNGRNNKWAFKMEGSIYG